MKNKKISDFGPSSKPQIVMLRERIWRFEISQSKVRRFFRDHKLGSIIGLIIILSLIVVRFAFVGFASTADFYPSSCLGNWENVQNALGKPDLPPGASQEAFTMLNSAYFGTSTAQMFCGNFTGDTDIAALTGKSFQEADLILSWSFVFPQEATTTLATTTDSSTDAGGGDGGADEIAPEATSTTSTDLSSASSDASSISSSTDESLPVVTSTDASDSQPLPQDVSSSDATASDASDAAPAVAPPAPAPTTTQDESPAPAPAPEPASTTDSDGSASDSQPTSWLWNFVGVAFADDSSSLAIDTSTASSTDSSTSIEATSSAEIGVPVEPQPAPISVNTSQFQNIVLPSSTANAILGIVYSTDGVTWQPVVNIDASNWQTARYVIPIHSWVELEHLQVAFVGLGASSSPQIFLDSAGVEVSYADAPPDPNTDTQATDTVSEAPSSTAGQVMPPTPVQLPPVQAFRQVFYPFAGQQCSVMPFSESIPPGGGGSFILKLTPPAAATSSLKKPQQNSPPLYDASLGALPTGISADIIQTGPGMDTVGVTTAPDVPPGSYNAVVVYKERQHDGTVEPNFCQFNIVITSPS